MTAMKLFTTVCAASMPLMKGADITQVKELQTKEFPDIDVTQLSGVSNDNWILHESQQQKVEVGSRVELWNMKGEYKDKNGSVGVVQRYNSETKKFQVKLDDERDIAQTWDAPIETIQLAEQQVEVGSRVQGWCHVDENKVYNGVSGVVKSKEESKSESFWMVQLDGSGRTWKFPLTCVTLAKDPEPVKVGSRVQIWGFKDDEKLNGSIGMVQGFDESKEEWIVLLDEDRGQLFDFGAGNQNERIFSVKASQVTVTTKQVGEGSRVQWWDQKKLQGKGSIYYVNKEQDKFTFIKDSDREKPQYYNDFTSAAHFVLLEEDFKVGSKVTNWFESPERQLTAGSTGVIQSCCKKTNQCLVKFDEKSSLNIHKSYLVPVSE